MQRKEAFICKKRPEEGVFLAGLISMGNVQTRTGYYFPVLGELEFELVGTFAQVPNGWAAEGVQLPPEILSPLASSASKRVCLLFNLFCDPRQQAAVSL